MKNLVENFFIRNNIPYELNIVEGNVDFIVDNIKFLVKPKEWFEMEESKEIIKQCKLNHIVIITNNEAKGNFGKPNGLESHGLKYLHKCPLPLIGVDIELLDNP